MQLVQSSPNSPSQPNFNIPDAPHSIEAEKALLGSVMINPDCIDDVRSLVQPSDFFLTRHETIFATMCALDDDDVEIDNVTLSDKFTDAQLKDVGGRAYIAELTLNIPSSLHVMHYADIVRRVARRRDLLRTADALRELAYDERLSVEQIIDATDTHIDSLRLSLPEPDARHASEGADRAKMYVADVIEGSVNTYVPTGIRAIDRGLGGGFGRGELAVVIAQRHKGKTSLAFNMLHAALAADVTALYCSVEFGYDKVLRQYIAFESGVPSAFYERGTANAEQYLAYTHAADKVKAQPFYILAKQPITMNKIAKRTLTGGRLRTTGVTDDEQVSA